MRNDVKALTLVPGSGGEFEVKSGDTLLYSKKETGEFPAHEEIVRLLRNEKK
ncbi:hypothetical protein ALCH109712_01420 [Alkalicoccus chagannorensis]